jgi:hypothetical protein
MDIDEFEDFLDADQGLAEDGSHKRTLADFASQQEAAQSLGGEFSTDWLQYVARRVNAARAHIRGG